MRNSVFVMRWVMTRLLTSIIEAAIQLPLAKHAQEWESMTKDEHPEDAATKKCKTLEENFETPKWS